MSAPSPLPDRDQNPVVALLRFPPMAAFLALAFFHPAVLRAEEIPSEVKGSLGILKQDTSTTSPKPLTFLGETLFLAEIASGTKVREWTFDASGVPLSVEVFDEELPPAVQAALPTILKNGGTLSSQARTFEHGKDVFEFEIETPKGTKSFAFYGDGRLQTSEVSVGELPQRISKVLARRFGGATPEKCFQCAENGVAYFIVGIARPNGPLWLTFDLEGTVSELEERIEWNQAPQALQTALLEKFTTQDHTRIIRTIADDETNFEIWVFTQERLEIYSGTPEGGLEKLR